MSLDFLQNVMQACFRFFFRVLYTLYFISFLNGFLGEKERMQCYHYVTTPVHNESDMSEHQISFGAFLTLVNVQVQWEIGALVP